AQQRHQRGDHPCRGAMACAPVQSHGGHSVPPSGGAGGGWRKASLGAGEAGGAPASCGLAASACAGTWGVCAAGGFAAGGIVADCCAGDCCAGDFPGTEPVWGLGGSWVCSGGGTSGRRPAASAGSSASGGSFSGGTE